MKGHCYCKLSHLIVAVFNVYHVTSEDVLLVNILDIRIHSGKYHLHSITSAITLITEVLLNDVLIVQLLGYVVGALAVFLEDVP